MDWGRFIVEIVIYLGGVDFFFLIGFFKIKVCIGFQTTNTVLSYTQVGFFISSQTCFSQDNFVLNFDRPSKSYKLLSH